MQIWQPSDSVKLRKIRLESGMDVFSIAKRCSISTNQLQELEGQGNGTFYSEAIKYQVGTKVLSSFGHATGASEDHQVRVESHKRNKAEALSLQVVPPAENRRLLYSIGGSLFAVGLMMSIVNLMNGMGLRPGAVLTACIGVSMIAASYVGRTDWAVVLMSLGMLSATITSALPIRGLEHVAWIALPMAIMAVGWFVGKRASLAFAAISVMSIVGFYALHKQHRAFDATMPLDVTAAALIGACLIASFIANSICETFGKQFKLIQESRAELHAVMDSTRAMIWSVDLSEFRLRVFNRNFAHQISEKFGVTPTLGLSPHEVFLQKEMAQHWHEKYTQTLEAGGAAWEEDIFNDGRIFEISCQKIIESNRAVGLAAYALEMSPTQPVEPLIDHATSRY